MTTDSFEVRIGRVLGIGSKASTLFLTVGLVLVLADPASRAASSLLNIGLVLVLATPVMRVIVSNIEFVRAREWQFVVMTLTVLGVLAGSVIAAMR